MKIEVLAHVVVVSRVRSIRWGRGIDTATRDRRPRVYANSAPVKT